jgi:hypothetical protein
MYADLTQLQRSRPSTAIAPSLVGCRRCNATELLLLITAPVRELISMYLIQCGLFYLHSALHTMHREANGDNPLETRPCTVVLDDSSLFWLFDTGVLESGT